ncbi:MAG TPA: type II secretion system F family protein [Thermoplasmata archaeon]|nr:type II secretion system F family protein [Thermoplasmata archaeon]
MATSTFDQLETRKTLVKTKRFRPGEEATRGHHIIKLPKGAKPVSVRLTQWEETCWRLFGDYIHRRYKGNQDLEEALIKAHMRLRAEEYLAVAYTTVLLAGLMVGILGVVMFVIFGLLLNVFFLGALFLAVGIFIPIIIYGFYFGLGPLRGIPAGAANRRARKINKKISGAMSFISAMASAEVPVDVIFKELSKQPVYGEVAKEAEWITRDTELLGKDILTAIRRGALRSPSPKFQDFLQGVVTTSTSGGQLKPYFLLKAEQYEKEDRLEMRKKMETLGMLAETFVTVVVAFPLFLVVIMAIMALINKTQGGFVITLLFVVVGLMIPLSQFGFIFVIWNMEQEA